MEMAYEWDSFHEIFNIPSMLQAFPRKITDASPEISMGHLLGHLWSPRHVSVANEHGGRTGSLLVQRASAAWILHGKNEQKWRGPMG